MFKKILLIASIFSLLAFPIFAAETTTYKYTTSSSVKFAWDPVVGASYYEVEAENLQRNEINNVVFKNSTGVVLSDRRTTETSVSFVAKRTGKPYIVRVRACTVDTNALVVCSDWSNSNNSESATVNGAAAGWDIFIAPTAPGASTIER